MLVIEDVKEKPWFATLHPLYKPNPLIEWAKKEVPGFHWDGDLKKWLCPQEMLPAFSQRYVASGGNGGILDKRELETSFAVPGELKNLWESLHEYQRAGIRQAICHRRWIFNDEMGLGKTVQAILASRIVQPRRILVVCPAIAKLTWERELCKWWPAEKSIGIIRVGIKRKVITKKDRGVYDNLESYRVVIVSYELVDQIADSKFDCFIFDECHRIKSHQARSTQVIARMVANSSPKHVFGLTATLLPDKPRDSWGIVHSIFPGRFGKADRSQRGCFVFDQHYTLRRVNSYGKWEYPGVDPVHADELAARLRALSSRTTKHEVAHLLPPFTVQTLFVESTNADNRYASIAEALETAGDEKAAHVLKWLEDAQESATHIAILTHRRNLAAKIADCLRSQMDCPTIVVDGEIPVATRLKLIQSAKDLPRCILVATIQSVEESIDLTAFSQALIIELPFYIKPIIQVLGRFSRLSGKVPSNVTFMVVSGGPDEMVATKVIDKVNNINKLISGGQAETKLAKILDEENDDAWRARLQSDMSDSYLAEVM